ncbi:adenosine kinase [Amycolatopsis bartoniae]|uniref:Kinase n=1 Tax=Amycolatopsis bartoniae TaxID=941986 RepID=A0A8H9IZP9_9PSEU|nr:carbohydrate kinase family protein [Amycolatopsis bartoniae]MBB2938501.1 adenosine kinase [Amycolatopsis bartoniae]TVT10353.1 carbohydrate kinase family protein [Amycolatopsis bartoniae]GHF70558.1 kinase [Amycolatopsis bartoniae]
MKIAVSGSIALDHLMVFPGRFTDQFLPGRMDKVSLSFLVEELAVRPGGVAANIVYGLGSLGVPSVLIGSVGADFDGHRGRLEQRLVDTKSVHVSKSRQTARFLCTTDAAQNQIASFCSGAMVEMRDLPLGPVVDRTGGLDLVVVSPSDPRAMLAHTVECRERGIPFAADPSQQLANVGGDTARSLVDGATYLFTNEYEHDLLLNRTGWSHDELLARVGGWITTLGAGGAKAETSGRPPLTVPAVPVDEEVDPTGVGDAFRAGFLWGRYWRLGVARAMQAGCVLASMVLGSPGGQEYTVDRAGFSACAARVYGGEAAGEIESKLRV